MPWGYLLAEHRFGGWHKFQRGQFKNAWQVPSDLEYRLEWGLPFWEKPSLMMANPLREGYKKRKRWCERGLENLGERETESDT